MPLTIQTIEDVEEFILGDIDPLLAQDLKELCSAARWALENGYRPISTVKVSLKELANMKFEVNVKPENLHVKHEDTDDLGRCIDCMMDEDPNSSSQDGRKG